MFQAARSLGRAKGRGVMSLLSSVGCTDCAAGSVGGGAWGCQGDCSAPQCFPPLGTRERKPGPPVHMLSLLPHLLVTILLFKVASEPTSEQKKRHMKAELWRDS